MNSQQQQDAERASVTKTISEQDIAKLYYALDNFDQDLIPILSRLERAAMAGAELAKVASNVQVYDAVGCFDLRGFDELSEALSAYRSAIEEKNV